MQNRYTKYLHILFLLLVVSAIQTCIADEPLYQKGELWLYDIKSHTSIPNQDATGFRIVEIIDKNEEGFIATDSSSSGKTPLNMTINRLGIITEVNDGQGTNLDFQTKVPFQFIDLLHVGEAKEFGIHSNVIGNSTLSLSTSVKRVKDDDITVPAGEFLSCQHYVVTNELKINSGSRDNSTAMIREIYVHKKVNGSVKEIVDLQYLNPNNSGQQISIEYLLKLYEVKSE